MFRGLRVVAQRWYSWGVKDPYIGSVGFRRLAVGFKFWGC